MFLSSLAMQYHDIAVAALNGDYHTTHHAFFADENRGPSTRLRAWIHRLNTDFATQMRENGRAMALKDTGSKTNGNNGQKTVTEAEMKAWVKGVYSNTRGRELPGNYNHVLLTELFHQQSSRWQQLAEDHVDTVFEGIQEFVNRAISSLKLEHSVLMEVQETVSSRLQDQRMLAEKELATLCDDEQRHPVTYNHYYTDNVQKSRVGVSLRTHK